MSIIWREFHHWHRHFCALSCFWYNSTRHFWSDSDFLIQFKIDFPIKFDSDYWSGSTPTSRIWLAISDLTQLFWFNYTHHLRFNSTHFSFLFLIQLHKFDYPLPIQLIFSDSIWLSISNLILIIFFVQFNLVSLFNLNPTARIWIDVSNSTQTFVFNLTCYFLFVSVHISYRIRLPLHTFHF